VSLLNWNGIIVGAAGDVLQGGWAGVVKANNRDLRDRSQGSSLNRRWQRSISKLLKVITEIFVINDGASVEDEALTDHENEEVLDSPIDLNNLVKLCEGTEKCRVMKRQVKGKQVMVACGHLAVSQAQPRR
jgi:hypothetical protein